MDRFRRLPPAAVAASCLMAFLAAGPGIAGEPGAGGLPIERWRALMERHHVPGLAVAVVRDSGVVAVATLGLRDVERRLPVTPRTGFYVASCTKVFTAASAWSLAAEGRLDLDAPVRRDYRSFRLPDPVMADTLSLRDLLAHRPGLSCPPIGYHTAYTGQISDTTFDRLLDRTRVRGRFSYSNLHYQIAARALEERLHQPWQKILDERVLAPAGLSRTTARASRLYGDRDVALPYEFRSGRLTLATRKTDRTMHAAGGMGSTIEDLSRWLRIALGDGVLDGRRVLPEAMMRGLRTLEIAVEDRHPLREDCFRIGWAAGWELRTLAGDSMAVHGGVFSGAAAHVSFLPQRGVGVVVLANGNAPPLVEVVAAEAYDWAIGRTSPDLSERLDRFMSRMAPAVAPDTSHGRLTRKASAYAGRYTHPDWGTVDVHTRRGELGAHHGDWPLSIALTGDDRLLADGETPGRFEIDRRGRVTALWLRMDAADSARFVRR